MALDGVELTLVETTAELDEFRRWLGERRPIMGVDIESSGLSLVKDHIRLVQFGDARHGWAIPYRDWRGLVREVLAEYDGPMVLHHAKFDAGFLMRDGLPFPWPQVHDTMIMNFLVDSLGAKGLKPSAARYVDPRARHGEAELKAMMRKNRWTYATVPVTLREYWAYGALDTVLTAQLAEVQWPKVQPYREAYDLELACERVLCEMEMRGVGVDLQYCYEQAADLRGQLGETLERLGDLNPFAPRDVAEALIAEGARLTERTDSGQWKVTDDVLSDLEKLGSKLAGDVRTAREVQKLLSAYFENFIDHYDDGVLHPHINQLQARTGRMSVTEPALQTIPRKALVRDAFVPREGNKLVLCDYDNQELRVAAHLSQDANMIGAFQRGESLHDNTARALYGDGFTKKQRTTAKNSIFSKFYGAGISKFAKTAGVPESEAAAVFATLQRLYPAVDRTMAEITSAVRSREDGSGFGYVALGDGRHLRVKTEKAYVGFNARIQGECAVVLKRSLVDLDAAGLGPWIVLPIHDEAMFDIPAEHVDAAIPVIKRVMTRDEYTVPLTVSATVVDRWGEPYREAV